MYYKDKCVKGFLKTDEKRIKGEIENIHQNADNLHLIKKKEMQNNSRNDEQGLRIRRRKKNNCLSSNSIRHKTTKKRNRGAPFIRTNIHANLFGK